MQASRFNVQVPLPDRNEVFLMNTFSLAASSQTTATDHALFDGTFDFGHDPAAVSDFFEQAVQGRLDQLLQLQPRQVTIANGLLTHGVKRQTQVDVTLQGLGFTPEKDLRTGAIRKWLGKVARAFPMPTTGTE